MIQMLLPGLTALQNVHPMLVHFPIAFFLGSLAMEGIAVSRNEKFHFVATWMLYLGTISAAVTIPTGFLAMNSLAAQSALGHAGPGHEYIHIHRNWMVAVTLLGLCLSLYLFWINKKKKWASHCWKFLVGLVVLSALLVMGADRGGRLVFEFGIGVNPSVIKQATQGESHGENY